MMQPGMGNKAAPGEGCPRCGFAVYAAEAIPVRDRVSASVPCHFPALVAPAEEPNTSTALRDML